MFTDQHIETVGTTMEKKYHQCLEWPATRHLGSALAPYDPGALVKVGAVEGRAHEKQFQRLLQCQLLRHQRRRSLLLRRAPGAQDSGIFLVSKPSRREATSGLARELGIEASAVLFSFFVGRPTVEPT